ALALLLHGARRGLVVGLLRLLQLLVEQRRHVVVAAVAAAGAARLLPLHFAALHLGLGFQQPVERIHFRRQRLTGVRRVERGHRLLHRHRRRRHLIFFRHRLARLQLRLWRGLRWQRRQRRRLWLRRGAAPAALR